MAKALDILELDNFRTVSRNVEKSTKPLIILGLILLTASWTFAEGTGSILGQVSDAKTGIVLPDADVFIAGTKMRTVTDENGYFVFENVPEGTCTIEIKLLGYKATKNPEVSIFANRTTRQDCKLEFSYPSLMGSLTNISIGKISGRVTDDKTGEGLPTAKVVLVGTEMCATADTNGNFIIENVPEGTYRLEASMIGFQNSVAKRVLVTPGQTTIKIIKLKVTPIKNGITVG